MDDPGLASTIWMTLVNNIPLVRARWSLPVAEAQTGSWTGPLWVQKVGLVFKGFDQNHNGLHDLDDVEIMVYNYTSKGTIDQVEVIIDVDAVSSGIVCYFHYPESPLSPLPLVIIHIEYARAIIMRRRHVFVYIRFKFELTVTFRLGLG